MNIIINSIENSKLEISIRDSSIKRCNNSNVRNSRGVSKLLPGQKRKEEKSKTRRRKIHFVEKATWMERSNFPRIRIPLLVVSTMRFLFLSDIFFRNTWLEQSQTLLSIEGLFDSETLRREDF